MLFFCRALGFSYFFVLWGLGFRFVFGRVSGLGFRLGGFGVFEALGFEPPSSPAVVVQPVLPFE